MVGGVEVGAPAAQPATTKARSPKGPRAANGASLLFADSGTGLTPDSEVFFGKAEGEDVFSAN